MRPLCTWVLGWLLVPVAVGQALFFQQITTADGLSDNAITKLFQDRDGFLWIGTESGLNRYDGHHVRVWHAADGLGGEHVADLMQDRQGMIWAATQEGALARFSSDGAAVETFRPGTALQHAVPRLRLNCLFDLNDSTLLIGARRVPLIFMDKRTGRFSYWKGSGPITPAAALPQPVESSDWCHYIRDLGDGRLAIGFLLGFGQHLVDRNTGRLLGQAFELNGDKDQTITDALCTGDRLYGAGWQQRLHVHDLRSGQDLYWPMPDECRTLIQDDSLHLLIGTASSGLLRMDVRTGSYQVHRHRQGDPRSLSDDRVRALLRDREGRTWAGTASGLNVYAPKRWWASSVPLTTGQGDEGSTAVPFNIAELPSGELAVCTNLGLFMGMPDGPLGYLPVRAAQQRLRTTTVLCTPGSMFLGAEEGLFHWDDGTHRAVAMFQPGDRFHARTHGESRPAGTVPALFQVRSLLADTIRGRPALVLGVLGYGLAILDLSSRQVELFAHQTDNPGSLGGNLVTQLVRDRTGTYWAATAEGLYQWDLDRRSPSNRFRAFRANADGSMLPSDDITALLPDTQGRLWIAMRNGGLALWNGDHMRRFSLPACAGGTVHGLAFDRSGRLWCATRGCFTVLDTALAAWEVIFLPQKQTSAAVPLGLRTLRDGRMAFVADNTLQVFDPAVLVATAAPPAPYLTAMELGDSSVMGRLHKGVLVLAAASAPLRISISALDLAPLQPYTYSLELEGVDPKPRPADAGGSLVYASLPHGTYRLLARTVGGNGVTSAPVALAVIQKAAPIQQRWWFYWAIAAATGAVAYALSRYRYGQKLHLQQVRNRIASDLHDEVGSSLSAITIGSQLAAGLSGKDKGQVREIMLRLSETSNTSLRRMRDIVWAIDPLNDEGEALVARMRRIAQELLADQGVDVAFSITGGVEHLKLPMGARKDLLLLFKEAVHNCSKYADAGTVQVSLHRRSSRLWLSVKDDGKGFNPALHPDGHGLGSMVRRAQALQTELVLKSGPGLGTLVGVEVELTKIRD